MKNTTTAQASPWVRTEDAQRRVLQTVLYINIVAFFVMVVGSIYGDSSALFSGTLDNFGDALTYAISLAVISSTSLVKARVAFLKGLLILMAAALVALNIAMNMLEQSVPVVGTMGAAAVINLAANASCLYLLTPFKKVDVNMQSAWECSRNDVIEGLAILLTTAAVWFFESGLPDLIIAAAILVLFTRSAFRVMKGAWLEMALTPTTPGQHRDSAACLERLKRAR